MFDAPRRLHPAAIIIKFGEDFVRFIKAAVIPLGATILSSSGRHSGAQFAMLAVLGIIALVTVVSLISPILHFLSTRFFIESEALVINSGFVWRKHRTIPLARIQNVNLERTLWHRILGAAAVKIETAAGRKAEGDLAALSIEDANRLLAVLLQRQDLGADVVPPQSKSAVLYDLSLRQVLLAGALENRVLYIVAGIAAVFQHEGTHRLVKPLLTYAETLGPVATVFVGALVFLILIVVGWLVSIIISATRFYGFRIEKHERGLLLTHGLITQFRTIVPVGRIQDVRIVEPILFRLLGYCELYADTAGSFDKKDVASANKICPLVPEFGVSRIGKLLLPEFEFERLDWKMVSRKTIARRAYRYFLMTAIIAGFPLSYWLGWHALWAAPPVAIWCCIMGVIAYRYVGYSYTNDILASRHGVFRKSAVIIPFDRIQHYTINASFFQRLQGLATITAVSASSAGHPIHITDMDAGAAEHLRQTVGNSIRNHLGSRRAGL